MAATTDQFLTSLAAKNRGVEGDSLFGCHRRFLQIIGAVKMMQIQGRKDHLPEPVTMLQGFPFRSIDHAADQTVSGALEAIMHNLTGVFSVSIDYRCSTCFRGTI